MREGTHNLGGRSTSVKLRFCDRLTEEWQARHAKNPAFSQRAFARTLDLDPSDLNKMMRGTRMPGRKLAEKIGRTLGWLGTETEICFRYRPNGPHQVERESETLSEELFESLSHWKYFAILSLTKTADFEPNLEFVAKRLALPLHEVDVAVTRLKRLGLLEVDADGQWQESSNNGTTSLGDPKQSSAARRQLQKSYVEQSLKTIDTVPVDRRNHSTLTMEIDPKRLDTAREMISVFRRDLGQFLAQGNCTEVYSLNLGLFPLTGERSE